MAMRDWFRRKPAPEEVGTSKGGSRLIKYGNGDVPKPEIGFLEESTLANTEERERVYSQLFGESDTVLHELLPLIPHIDVYRFPPNGKREFFTYVTGGMSDLPMNAPSELGAEYRRAELVFYSTENRDDLSGATSETCAFSCMTIVLGCTGGIRCQTANHRNRSSDTQRLDTLFFMPSIVRPDSTLGDRLKISSEPVQLIWCVPITTAECQLKLDEGTAALYELFGANDHPFAFSGDRRSYI